MGVGVDCGWSPLEISNVSVFCTVKTLVKVKSSTADFASGSCGEIGDWDAVVW